MRRAVGPSDEEVRLRSQIEQSRRELGQTVEALAAKADIGRRIQTKVQAKVDQEAEALQARGDQIRQRVSQVGQRVRQLAPAQLPEAAGQAVRGLSEHPGVAVGTVLLLVGLAIGLAARRT